MFTSFTYEALPMRVVFGPGTSAAVATEALHLGLRRLLVLSTKGHRHLADRVASTLGDRAVGVFDGARMHVPVDVADTAAAWAGDLNADGCVAVGGGSTVGLAKAVTLRTGLPAIALPTTFAGSEMTSIWGVTENGTKRTGRDPAVLPRSVIYDPDLVLTLPAELAVTSGLNAVAHAVEGLYAPDTSPIVALMAEQGTRLITGALPRIVTDPDDPAPRAEALRGSWLCGAVLGATTMSLHHKLCHVLGGTFDLPHAPTHTVVLPHALAYNATAAAEALTPLHQMLGDDPAGALWDLAAHLGAPTSLAAIGMPADGLPEVVRQVRNQPYANPRPVTEEGLTDLLVAAYQGQRPSPPSG